MAANKAKHTAILRKTGKAAAGKQASLTSEQIADDLKAFRKTGGKIEVLGNTNTFKRIS